MKSNIEVLFFPNGNTAVFKDGKQVTELQENWSLLFAFFLKDRGVDITEVKFRFPSGQTAEVFKTTNNKYNWRFKW